MGDVSHWHRIQEVLRGSMTQESFRNWVEPVQFSHFGENSDIHLMAPNSDVKDWLEQEFLTKIVAAARRTGLDIGQVAIDVAGSGPQPVQGAFDFDPEPSPFNQKYTFERFVVGSCNDFAHAAARAVATRPAKAYNPLYIYSGVGMGKTHLLHAIGNQLYSNDSSMRIVYTSAEEFMNEMIKSIRYSNMRRFHDRFRKADALLVDDVQVIGSKERTQEEFFHTFNALHNSGRQIVLCSDSNPATIPGLVGRLRSRFSWGMMADIQPPDLETKMAILDRMSDEEQMKLPEDVCSYIATHLNTNIRELEGVLIRLIERARFVNSKITLAMVKNMFGSVELHAPEGPSAESIQQAVAARFGLPVVELLARNNSRNVAYPRQIAMYLCKRLTRMSLTNIGKVFRKHHTTVLHSIAKIEREIKTDSELKATVEELLSKLKPTGYSHYA